MPRRLDTQAISTARLYLNFTPEDDARVAALAWYLRVTVSELLRNLAKEKRHQLVSEGKRPPLHPREGARAHTGPRGRGGADFIDRKVRVSQVERDEVHGLAQYLDKAVNEMLVEFVDEKRAELLAAGQRPPLRIPDAYLLEDSGSGGQWLPRK